MKIQTRHILILTKSSQQIGRAKKTSAAFYVFQLSSILLHIFIMCKTFLPLFFFFFKSHHQCINGFPAGLDKSQTKATEGLQGTERVQNNEQKNKTKPQDTKHVHNVGTQRWS